MNYRVQARQLFPQGSLINLNVMLSVMLAFDNLCFCWFIFSKLKGMCDGEVDMKIRKVLFSAVKFASLTLLAIIIIIIH